MDIVFERCAGVDVHKRTVVVCLLTPGERGRQVAETRTFGTTTSDLLRLSDWLSSHGCTHVGLESTGDYWKPVHNILEGSFEVWLLNAQHLRAVPGRKTDVKDAQWIAELLRHGLVRPSFIPPRHQRDLRDLTRHRTSFVRERATLVNRVQKVLEDANLKLGSVASDVLGLSGRAMLAAIIAGERDGAALAALAKGKLRKKREQLEQALTGRVRPHHRFLLAELLVQIDGLEETIARFDDGDRPRVCGQRRGGGRRAVGHDPRDRPRHGGVAGRGDRHGHGPLPLRPPPGLLGGARPRQQREWRAPALGPHA